MNGGSTSYQGRGKAPLIDDGVKDENNDLEKQIIELAQKTFQDPSHVQTPRVMEETQKISMLPDKLKEKNLASYEPKVVSIGPYHRGKPQCASMEDHKQRALETLAKISEVTPQDYEVEMRKVVEELKDSYTDLAKFPTWEDDDKFIQLMIRDGCFIIEFLRTRVNFFRNYSATDPIFSKLGQCLIYNDVMRDLHMVENQLPCLALETLWSLCGEGGPRETAAMYQLISSVKKPGFHMLDTYMEGLLEKGKGSIHDDDEPRISCASGFGQFNVRFQKAETYNDMLFDPKTGILALPSINIDEHTVCTYLNMVSRALTCESPTTSVFIIYAQLMGTLVQSSEDVRLLQSNGIIINKLRISHDAIVEVIQEIFKGTICPDRRLENNHNLSHVSVLEDLNGFCHTKTNRSKRTLNVWFSTLKETYFRTPWSGISLAAAIALLGLTVTQTIYAILSYYKEENKEME